jgi:2-oxoglutarate ferredoxin oxidoreductase subunit alpha
MQEGISYLAGAELPCVIVNVMRGGPGLGNIAPSQSDYFQATKGGGHGDYKLITLAPASVQEIIDLMAKAFDLADQYRTQVMVLGDGILGQMMEPVQLGEMQQQQQIDKPWAASGMGGRTKPNIINSLYIVPEVCEEFNNNLFAKYDKIVAQEQMWEEYQLNDAEIVLVAYGTSARICKAAVDKARVKGIKAGLIRPITLWPFPSDVLAKAAQRAKGLLTVEMSMGQMVEDVRLAANGACPVHFYGRTGGMVPMVQDVLTEIEKIAAGGDQQ